MHKGANFVQRFAYAKSRQLYRRDLAQPERPPGSEAHKICYAMDFAPRLPTFAEDMDVAGLKKSITITTILINNTSIISYVI